MAQWQLRVRLNSERRSANETPQSAERNASVRRMNEPLQLDERNATPPKMQTYTLCGQPSERPIESKSEMDHRANAKEYVRLETFDCADEHRTHGLAGTDGTADATSGCGYHKLETCNRINWVPAELGRPCRPAITRSRSADEVGTYSCILRRSRLDLATLYRMVNPACNTPSKPPSHENEMTRQYIHTSSYACTIGAPTLSQSELCKMRGMSRLKNGVHGWVRETYWVPFSKILISCARLVTPLLSNALLKVSSGASLAENSPQKAIMLLTAFYMTSVYIVSAGMSSYGQLLGNKAGYRNKEPRFNKRNLPSGLPRGRCQGPVRKIGSNPNRTELNAKFRVWGAIFAERVRTPNRKSYLGTRFRFKAGAFPEPNARFRFGVRAKWARTEPNFDNTRPAISHGRNTRRTLRYFPAYAATAALLAASMTTKSTSVPINALVLHVFFKLAVYWPAYLLDLDMIRSSSDMCSISALLKASIAVENMWICGANDLIGAIGAIRPEWLIGTAISSQPLTWCIPAPRGDAVGQEKISLCCSTVVNCEGNPFLLYCSCVMCLKGKLISVQSRHRCSLYLFQLVIQREDSKCRMDGVRQRGEKQMDDCRVTKPVSRSSHCFTPLERIIGKMVLY
ncbi:hypothetical protein FB451DRAFT_1170582 [Mycena latifolia]|nr:hypothetical protein FB451DRAFT_1170582 [Mycena latifolia]